jgi:hypothetical protein
MPKELGGIGIPNLRKDEPHAPGMVALVESSGGLSTVKRV